MLSPERLAEMEEIADACTTAIRDALAAIAHLEKLLAMSSALPVNLMPTGKVPSVKAASVDDVICAGCEGEHEEYATCYGDDSLLFGIGDCHDLHIRECLWCADAS